MEAMMKASQEATEAMQEKTEDNQGRTEVIQEVVETG
jgi:hypothetical protein